MEKENLRDEEYIVGYSPGRENYVLTQQHHHMSCGNSFNMDKIKRTSRAKLKATKRLTLQTKFDSGKNHQFLLTANSNHA